MASMNANDFERLLTDVYAANELGLGPKLLEFIEKNMPQVRTIGPALLGIERRAKITRLADLPDHFDFLRTALMRATYFDQGLPSGEGLFLSRGEARGPTRRDHGRAGSVF